MVNRFCRRLNSTHGKEANQAKMGLCLKLQQKCIGWKDKGLKRIVKTVMKRVAGRLGWKVDES